MVCNEFQRLQFPFPPVNLYGKGIDISSYFRKVANKEKGLPKKKSPLGKRISDREGKSLKRLTIDISADLHTAIKVSCAERGIRMADEIRTLLKEKYQPSEKKR